MIQPRPLFFTLYNILSALFKVLSSTSPFKWLVKPAEKLRLIWSPLGGDDRVLDKVTLNWLKDRVNFTDRMIGDYNGKFFAPEAVDVAVVRKFRMDTVTEGGGETVQHFISHKMAVSIINWLEVIDVQATDDNIVDLFTFCQVFDLLAKGPVIEKAS